MKIKGSFTAVLLSLLLFTAQAWASTANVAIEGDVEAGTLYPVDVQVISGESDGNKFVSVSADILDSIKNNIDETIEAVNQPLQEWSYNRGMGTLPDVCTEGYTASAGMCAQDCPAGFESVGGVCWQDCPPEWSEGGKFCTLWKGFPKTITRESWVQTRKLMQCEAGKVNEAGLCYEPCAETFTGVGPLCYGRFGGARDIARIRDQAQTQHDAVLATTGDGGIVLSEAQTPKLKTDLSFAPIVCLLDAVEGGFGLPLPDPVNVGGSIVNAAEDGITGAISSAIEEEANNAWFVPTLSQTVLFDFTSDVNCVDDGTQVKASLNFHPSITVKASTRTFDTALHNLAGVDVGIMQVSLYELIPFRVYGTVGATLGTDTTMTSTIDRSQPPVIIEGRQHANSTALKVIPEMELWLSSTAYLRITSFLSFIPDLLQLGAEFKLWVLELSMPYQLEEGVRTIDGVDTLYRQESLTSDISAGRGYVDSFLTVLGIETNAFGEKGDVQWDGYHENKLIFDKAETEAVTN